MLSKKLVKDIQSLGHKKWRDAARLFIAEGPKIINELIELIPQQFEQVYATPEWTHSNAGVPVTVISEEELEKISSLKTPHQVLAVIRQFTIKEPNAPLFTLYLDTIQDPGNFGTIIRIADWFGVQNIVCSSGCADMYNPKVVQSSMASIARVNIFYDEDDSWLSKQNTTIYAATLDGNSLFDSDKTDKGMLIIGNESKGISQSLLDLATDKITIPKRGNAESLNAAVATGIILSHLIK